MDFLLSTLKSTGTTSEIQCAEVLRREIVEDGFCGFRRPRMKFGQNDGPSFIIIGQNSNITLVDVFDCSVDRINGDYWVTRDGKSIYSREYMLDSVESEIENRIKQDGELYNRKKKQVEIGIRKIVVLSDPAYYRMSPIFDIDETDCEYIYGKEWQSELMSKLLNSGLDPLSDTTLNRIQALLDGTQTLSRKKGTTDSDLILMGDFIEKSLENTFKLDKIQRSVSFQIPDGPQRIRGLAGTGKTVILSIKAALAHADHSEFNILYTFHTQSLYRQIRELISKFYFSEEGVEVDWENLDVLHSWGGASQEGVYSRACKEYGISPLNFQDVKFVRDPLEYIFRDLLLKIKDRIVPKYDIVLMDEAQDLSPAFFEFLYLSTKHPKRIIWAYDEFQTLTELRIKEPEDLFGKNIDGSPRMPNRILEGEYDGAIEKDFVLPVCYRTPKLILMTAHALALGLYRDGGLIEILEDAKSWKNIGYSIIAPKDKTTFDIGDLMEIERAGGANQNNLEYLLETTASASASELLECKQFESREEEILFVVNRVDHFVKTQKIDPDRIIVISMHIKESESIFNRVRKLLEKSGIKSVTPGYVESSRTFRSSGCVTLSTPFRAKGNEGDIVFIIGSDIAISDTTFRARNSLFVSITRTRGWCYLTGSGPSMPLLVKEVESIKRDFPYFKFRFPNLETIKRRRSILRADDNKQDQIIESLNGYCAENPDIILEYILSKPELIKAIEREKGDVN